MVGWYGFNGAACTSVEQLDSVFVTTTIAPAIATVVCLIFTWVKYKKPDISMCLNASLAVLVAITAPCDVTDAFGAIMIGAIAGLLVVFGVWFLDYKLRIDDPVGAVAVRCLNGIWGTIAIGLFATNTAPGYSIANASGKELAGLFYGGGFELLGLQLLGFVTVAAWTAVTITITFFVIKAFAGLRVTEGEEIIGLDAALLPKVKVEVVVSKIPVENVIETAKKALYTGHICDGKIFVYSVDKVVKVRTGEEDFSALQDVE